MELSGLEPESESNISDPSTCVVTLGDRPTVNCSHCSCRADTSHSQSRSEVVRQPLSSKALTYRSHSAAISCVGFTTFRYQDDLLNAALRPQPEEVPRYRSQTLRARLIRGGRAPLARRTRFFTSVETNFSPELTCRFGRDRRPHALTFASPKSWRYPTFPYIIKSYGTNVPLFRTMFRIIAINRLRSVL